MKISLHCKGGPREQIGERADSIERGFIER